MNDLSQNIDLPSTLTRAERLFLRFQRTVEAIDRKTHFPAPSSSDSLRSRKPQAALPHPPDAPQSETDNSDGKNKSIAPAQQPQQLGGLVGAIAAIGAAQRRPAPSSQPAQGKGKGPASGTAGTAQASGSDAKTAGRDASAGEEGADKKRVISPELRDLLSRRVPKLDKKTVKEHGGGIN